MAQISQTKQMHALDIPLTEEQKKQVERFWAENGALGNVEIKVHVVNDKISPASIQVGTAK